MRTLDVLFCLGVLSNALLGQQNGSGIQGAKRPGPLKTDEFNDRPKGEPKKGGEIVQAQNVNFRSLDAYQDTSSVTSELVHMYIEEGLVDSDPETWEQTPKLAERWDTEDNLELKDGKIIRGKVSETADAYEIANLKGEKNQTVKKEDVKEIRYGTSFTFHLRKGVNFHNGDGFTAKDVEFTFKLYSNPKNGMPSIQGYFDKIKECTVIDDYTVRLTYAEQYWMALGVCGGYLYVRPRKAWDPNGLLDKNPDEFFKTFNQHPLMMNPIGTGPYQFDSYKKDFEVVVRRFDGWWGAKMKGPQYGQWPDKIRVRIIKDVVAQLQALKNEEIDYVTTVPPEQFDDFFSNDENRKKFAAVTIVYPSYGYIGFNLRREMWKDKRLRWALAHGSVDNDKFIREVLKGRAERVAGDYYRYCDSYNPELKSVPYDPKKAEEFLAASGWWDSDDDGILDKEGKKLEFEMLIRDMPPTMPAMQHLLQMQANLKKLGIKMEIRKLEWSTFLEKIEKGDFDVCRLGWAMASPPNQQDIYQIWHSSQIGENGSNHVAYPNPELDRLLVDIRRELNAQKRNAMEWKVQKILYEDQPYNWLYMPAELRIYNKKWRGVRFWVPRPCHSLNEWHLGE